MLQQVLTIGRAVFHLTDDTNQFRMQSVNAQVDGSTFTGFYDFFFYLFAHFGYHFLNTCRVNTSVRYQLMQGQTSHFATYRIECGKNDCFRSIVYNDFYTGSRFQSTDITAFTTDDASFDFIGLNMEYGYGIFNSCLCRYSLDRLYYDSFGFFAGRQFRIVHDIVDVRLCLCLGFLFQ